MFDIKVPTYNQATAIIREHDSAKLALGAVSFVPLLGGQLSAQLALKVLGMQGIDLSYMLKMTWNYFGVFMKTPFPYILGRTCQPIGSALIFHEFFQSYLLDKTFFPIIGKISPTLKRGLETKGKIIRIILTSSFFAAANYTLYYRHEIPQEAMLVRTVNDLVLGLFCSTLREMTGNYFAPMALSIVKNELAPIF